MCLTTAPTRLSWKDMQIKRILLQQFPLDSSFSQQGCRRLCKLQLMYLVQCLRPKLSHDKSWRCSRPQAPLLDSRNERQ